MSWLQEELYPDKKQDKNLSFIFDLYIIMQYFIGNDIDLYKKQHL